MLQINDVTKSDEAAMRQLLSFIFRIFCSTIFYIILNTTKAYVFTIKTNLNKNFKNNRIDISSIMFVNTISLIQNY